MSNFSINLIKILNSKQQITNLKRNENQTLRFDLSLLQLFQSPTVKFDVLSLSIECIHRLILLIISVKEK